MSKKVTSPKVQRLSAYNDIICKNRFKFKAGFIFNRDEFIDAFGLTGIPKKGNYATMHRGNLKLVSAQQEINTLLRESGMYLKSSHYYSLFTICEKERTKGEVKRYSTSVDRNEATTDRLVDCMEARGKRWGTYLKVPKRNIASLNNHQPTARHEKVKTRLTHF